jgi:hypothetical protein
MCPDSMHHRTAPALESRLQPVNGRRPAEAGTPGAMSGLMFQTSSAGSGFPGSIPRPRQVSTGSRMLIFRPDITALESRLQPDQAFPAVCPGLGRHPTGSSRDSRSFSYPEYFLKLHQPDQAFLAGCPALGRYPPAQAGTPEWYIRVICSTFISQFSIASASRRQHGDRTLSSDTHATNGGWWYHCGETSNCKHWSRNG